MKILIAPDAFKGSLDSPLACQTIADALGTSPSIETIQYPMADGGEGTAAILNRYYQAEVVACQVNGPLPGQVINTHYGWVAQQQLAILDAASACGLPLTTVEQRNPMISTSYGVGQLIQAAINNGANRILLGVGGTATMDAGMGMLQALGWKVVDSNQQPIAAGAQALQNIATIEAPTIKIPRIDVLCDVTNPLLGDQGAARIFGKQKGASDNDISLIEMGYQRIKQWCQHHGYPDISTTRYGGSAGGLAITAKTFLNATLHSGSAFIAKAYQLEQRIHNCDLVVSGEGCLDEQSLHGKVISIISKLCTECNKPLWVFAGNILLDSNCLINAGISHAQAINNPELSLQENIELCQRHLYLTVRSCSLKLHQS